MVQLLLEQTIKPNIEMRDKGNRTALYWTVRQNEPECLKLLVENGANVFVLDDRGKSVADEAKGFMLDLVNHYMYLQCVSALSSSFFVISLQVLPEIVQLFALFAYGSAAKNHAHSTCCQRQQRSWWKRQR